MFELGSTTVDFAKDIDQGSDRWEKQAKLEGFKAKFSRDQMPGRFADNTLGMKVFEALQKQCKRWAEGDSVGPEGVSDGELRWYLDKVETTYAEVQLAGFETAVRSASAPASRRLGNFPENAASLDFIAKIAMALNADPDELVRRYRKPKMPGGE